jgi:hypothetical protein
VAKQFYTYAMESWSASLDACAAARFSDTFAAKGHDLRELAVAIATSEQFRFVGALQ